MKKLPNEEIVKEGDSLKIECRVTEAARDNANAKIDVKHEGNLGCIRLTNIYQQNYGNR